MKNNLTLTQKLDQRLSLNHQLTQAISLLQYNCLDLRQVIQQAVDSNPLLEYTEEEVDDDYRNKIHYDQYKKKSKGSNNDVTDDDILESIKENITLRQYLIDQTYDCHFDDTDQQIAEAIIDSIDDSGRLIHPLDTIISHIHIPVTEAHVESILSQIQTFDPPGVGARSLQESIVLQLKYKYHDHPHLNNILTIIEHYYDEFASGKFTSFKKKLNLSTSEFDEIIYILQSLNYKSVTHQISDTEIYIEPDLYVIKKNDEWEVMLNEKHTRGLSINTLYANIVKNNKSDKQFQTLKQELIEAKWLIKAIEKRNETILTVANYIVKKQSDFLTYGESHLKPMTISDVSMMLNYHESTISRVTNGKYISTPRGLLELKFFFPSKITSNTGDLYSDLAIKDIIKSMIDNESVEHILSDNDITALLNERGLNIARRTVAKYREALNILPSYQRAQLKRHLGSTLL